MFRISFRRPQVKDLNAAKAKVPFKTAQDVDNQIKWVVLLPTRSRLDAQDLRDG